MKKKREILPDFLKGMAVILMIQVHIMELFAKQVIYTSLIGEISLFLGGVPAAPVFMLLMGYFAAKSKRSAFSQVWRGMKLIFLGLILNILLNLHLLIRIFAGEYELNPWEYILGADILFLAGLSLILLATLKQVFKKKFYLYFILALLLVFVHPILPSIGEAEFTKYLQAFLYGNYHWSYFPLLPWIAYPLTGFTFGLLNRQKAYEKILKYENYVLIISLAFFVIGLPFGFDISANLELYYHHGWMFFLWAICFIIFISILLKKLFNMKQGDEQHGGSLVSLLVWLGKNVTAVYFIQWVIIGNIATAIYKTQELWSLPLWFLGVTVFSILMLWFREKFFRWRRKGMIT